MISNKFIGFTTKIYPHGQLLKYMRAQLEESQGEEEDEGEEWKALQKAVYNNEPPTPQYVKIFVDPTQISIFNQAYSMEESISNPDNPMFDVVDIVLNTGTEIQVACSIEEFQEKLDAFFNKK